MVLPRRAPGLVLLAATALLAGCNRPALKPREFRAQVNAICADALQRQRALQIPARGPDALPGLRRLRAIGRQETNRIAALNPPLGYDTRHDRIVDAAVREDEATGRLIRALERDPQARGELPQRRVLRRQAARSARIMRRQRLFTCARRRATPPLA